MSNTADTNGTFWRSEVNIKPATAYSWALTGKKSQEVKGGNQYQEPKHTKKTCHNHTFEHPKEIKELILSWIQN